MPQRKKTNNPTTNKQTNDQGTTKAARYSTPVMSNVYAQLQKQTRPMTYTQYATMSQKYDQHQNTINKGNVNIKHVRHKSRDNKATCGQSC